ncbi:long-chain-fatty-acid--CoA ligase [Halobacillus sp. Cin3]|uniref:class I adenylate-forming enzyme family protein n=1 Tax=Halobacillus sp. Cin3 TaxID=2928441 RepID=UPI00248DEF84|nr:long-chain-fatty-acid--CoA ligase [Halobacillus sp. Cin3]
MNVSEMLAYQARKYPDKDGLISPDRRLSYKEWNEQVNQMARAFMRLGVERGDKIVIHMPNTIEFIVSYFAAHRAGAVVVPIHARLIEKEVSYIYDHSDAVVLLTHEQTWPQVKGLAEDNTGTFIKTGASQGNWLSYSALLAQEEALEVVNDASEEEEASILYTSGTTGTPKGVVFTHKNILSVSIMMAIEMEMKVSSRILHMMPLSHSAPLHLFLTAGTYVGAAHVTASSFTPDLLLELASREKTTHFFGAPVAYLMTARHPDVADTDMSWMKHWVYGGAPLSRTEVDFIQKQLDTESLYCVYGLTEAGPNGTLLLPSEHERKAGSIGQRAALNCEMKITRDDGQETGAGEVGEICLRGDGVMKAYYKDPDLTREVIQDGWLKTGDLAVRDEEGYVWVVDRMKDMIISGGVNIYPREIETILLQHPLIEDAAVTGVPHPDWGETVKAFIVSHSRIDQLEEECRSFLENHLAGYKIPRLYEEVQELPRNATGKLLKHRLREENQQVQGERS